MYRVILVMPDYQSENLHSSLSQVVCIKLPTDNQMTEGFKNIFPGQGAYILLLYMVR